MATQITEQARSSLDSPQRTIDEARDLNSRRASSLLDASTKFFGWISGRKSDIPKLRELGVCGQMTFRKEGSFFSFFTRIGVIEDCECTESVMQTLIAKWPGFWPNCFTGCLPPYGANDQLPREFQKYWHYLPTSAGSVAASPKTAAGRGFFRTDRMVNHAS